MDDIRLVIAALLFFSGFYLCYDLIVNGLHFAVLGASVLCFVLAHWILPDEDVYKNRGDTIELICSIIDFPFRAIAVMLRGLVGFLRHEEDVI